MNRGEVELAIVWVFNPNAKERPTGFLSQMGKSVRSLVPINSAESDSEVEDDEEGEEPVDPPVNEVDAAKLQKEKEEVVCHQSSESQHFRQKLLSKRSLVRLK